MTLTAPEKEVVRLVRRVLAAGAACAVLLAVAVIAAGHAAAAPSIVAGFLTAAASFVILVWISLRSLAAASGAGGRNSRATLVAIAGFVKLAILGALLWWLLRRGFVTPLAFLAGFTTMVAALLAVALFVKRPASGRPGESPR